MKRKYKLNDDIRALNSVFRKNGYSLYVVGGAVRDYILSLHNDDYDFTTDARPEEVIRMFAHHVIPTGLQHGTVTVRFRGQSYEVTTFREESGYSDSRHPDSVSFVRSLKSDLERRDFTINAFAADCEDGTIIDLHKGMDDLKAGLIRAIGDPDERFREDALRMLRAVRFASKLGFTIEDETFKAIQRAAHTILSVSWERIREELFKIIASDHPALGIETMRKAGLLHYVLPELEACINVTQGPLHHSDVYTHSLETLEMAREHSYPLSVRLAALLHDIAKPQCRKESAEGITFYNHDREGAAAADAVMLRLKCSNEERSRVTALVLNHMFCYTPEWSDGAVKRFVIRVRKENLDGLFSLRIADATAIDRNADLSLLWQLEERIEKLESAQEAMSLKDLAVNGQDLKSAGISPGPVMGKTLAWLLEKVLDQPELNTKAELMRLAAEFTQQL